MNEKRAPIRRQIVVPVPPAAAFRIFTSEIGQWWPLDGHSVFGPGGSVSFAGDRLVETSPEGVESVWGEVLEWHDDSGLRLTWHPGGSVNRATEVRLSFDTVDQAGGEPATLVTVEHRGWERTGQPETTRGEYESGWPGVLSRFGVATLPPPEVDPDELAWIMLRHTVAPAVHGPVFNHPDFERHAAFLAELATEGVLVAAGPLDIGGQPGANGMTVLAVPSDQAGEYRRRAMEEDQSVVRGLFHVDVVGWRVVMAGHS